MGRGISPQPVLSANGAARMAMHAHEWRSHYRKRQYRSEHEAVGAAAKANRAHPQPGNPVEAYRCRYCGSWHIGHGPSEGARTA